MPEQPAVAHLARIGGLLYSADHVPQRLIFLAVAEVQDLQVLYAGIDATAG